MPRRCSICHHECLEEINRALVEGVAFPALVAKYRVSKDALSRHKANHLPATLAKAQEAQEVAQADDLLNQVRSLQSRTLTILEAVEASGEYRTALAAIGEARRNLELLGKIAGELDERPVVNVLVSTEWVSIRTTVLEALSPYPQARAAVAESLVELESGH